VVKVNEKESLDYREIFQIVNSRTWQRENDLYKKMRKKWDDVGKKLYVTKVPLHVDIELTNDCNLKCFMCERNLMKRDTGYMEFSLYMEIIDYCMDHGIDSVKLNLWGESVLHPELGEMISYANEKGIINIQFNSNASLLTKDKSREIVEAGLHRLTLSVDSLSKSTYENIRVGSRIDQVIKNIDDLIEIRQELNQNTPLITAQIIQMKNNRETVKSFIDRFSGLVDYVSVTNVTAASGDERILRQSLLKYDPKEKFPCTEIWHRLSIAYNGDVTVCCQDYDLDLNIGNLKDFDIGSLWHSNALNELRERHKRLDFKGLICETCTANCCYEIQENTDLR